MGILEKNELKAMPNLNEILVKKRLERQLKVKNNSEKIGISSRSLAFVKDKYVPTHLRATGFPIDDNNCKREDQVSLRVANLSEDTTEHDLRDLFGQFGHITRVLIVLELLL